MVGLGEGIAHGTQDLPCPSAEHCQIAPRTLPTNTERIPTHTLQADISRAAQPAVGQVQLAPGTLPLRIDKRNVLASGTKSQTGTAFAVHDDLRTKDAAERRSRGEGQVALLAGRTGHFWGFSGSIYGVVALGTPTYRLVAGLTAVLERKEDGSSHAAQTDQFRCAIQAIRNELVALLALPSEGSIKSTHATGALPRSAGSTQRILLLTTSTLSKR